MFQQAKKNSRLELVAMNQIKYLHFAENKQGSQGLATESLNACTAVIVASPTGAILGHFSPRPLNAPINASAGDAHIRAKMDQFFTLFQSHKQDFPAKGGSTGLIAYGIFDGNIGLPSQKSIIENRFRQWGIPLKSVDYLVLEPDDPRPSGKGTVMILHQNAKVYLFVEDKARDVVPRSSVGSSVAGPSSSN